MPANAEANEADLLQRQQVVLTQAVLLAAGHLGMTNVVLARLLGISAASVSRMHTGNYMLSRDSKAFELAQLFVRLFRSLDVTLGGDSRSAQSWLTSGNLALGQPPLELIQTVRGLVATVSYVEARRAIP